MDPIKATNGFSVKVTESQIFVYDPAYPSPLVFPHNYKETQKQLVKSEDVDTGDLYLGVVTIGEDKGLLLTAEKLSQPVMVSMALFLQKLHNL